MKTGESKKVIRRNLPINKEYKLIDSFYTGGLIENPMVCDNCDRPIANVAVLEDEDGKKFHVGMDCAETLASIKNSMEFNQATHDFNEANAFRAKIRTANKKNPGSKIIAENTYWGNISVTMKDAKDRFIFSASQPKEFFLKHLPDLSKHITNPEKNTFFPKYLENYNLGYDYHDLKLFADKDTKKIDIDSYVAFIEVKSRTFTQRDGTIGTLYDYKVIVYKGIDYIEEQKVSMPQDVKGRILGIINKYEFNNFVPLSDINKPTMKQGGETPYFSYEQEMYNKRLTERQLSKYTPIPTYTGSKNDLGSPTDTKQMDKWISENIDKVDDKKYFTPGMKEKHLRSLYFEHNKLGGYGIDWSKFKQGGQPKNASFIDASDPLFARLQEAGFKPYEYNGEIEVELDRGPWGTETISFHFIQMESKGKTENLYTADARTEGVFEGYDINSNIFIGDINQAMEFIIKRREYQQKEVEEFIKTNPIETVTFKPAQTGPVVVGKIKLSEYDKRKRHEQGGKFSTRPDRIYRFAVNQDDYKGKIYHQLNEGYYLEDVTGSREEAGPFNSVDSLADYYEIKPKELYKISIDGKPLNEMAEGGDIRVIGYSGVGPEIIKAKKLRAEINISKEELADAKKYYNQYKGNPAFGEKWEKQAKAEMGVAQRRYNNALEAWKKEYGTEYEMAGGGSVGNIPANVRNRIVEYVLTSYNDDPSEKERRLKLVYEENNIPYSRESVKDVYYSEYKARGGWKPYDEYTSWIFEKQMAIGGEISPLTKVKANQSVAIAEVLKHYREYKDLGQMEGSFIYSLKDKEGTKEVSDATGLKEKIYGNLEHKGYIDVDYNDYTFTLTDEAKEFIERVNNRLETRREVKSGRDLFPETANIPELMAGGGMVYIYNEKEYIPNELIKLASSASGQTISTEREAIRHLGTENVAIKGLGKNKEYWIGAFKEGGTLKSNEIEVFLPARKNRMDDHFSKNDEPKYKEGQKVYTSYNGRALSGTIDRIWLQDKQVSRPAKSNDWGYKWMYALTDIPFKVDITAFYEDELYPSMEEMRKNVRHYITELDEEEMKSGGIVKESEVIDMMWILQNEGPRSFTNEANISIANELVNRGLAEKTGNEYGLTKVGEKELMKEGGSLPLHRIGDTDKKNKPTCNCPTMAYHNKLTDSQKEKLGNKYLAEGSTVTDNKSGVVSDIAEIRHNGFDLENQTSFEGAPKTRFHVPFEELVNKHASGDIKVGGYENTPEDHRILILVVKDIMACNIIKDQQNKIHSLESELQEAEEEVAMENGGTIGEIKATKAGVIKSVRDKKGKILNSVYIGDTLYKMNPASKTYTTEENKVLFKADINNLNKEKYSTWETGAKSEAVNALVLFADNTRNLAQTRDMYYRSFANRLKDGQPLTKISFRAKLIPFYIKTDQQFRREMKHDEDAMKLVNRITEEQSEDFIRLYVEEFPIWAKENYADFDKIKSRLSEIYGRQFEVGGKVDHDEIRAKKYWNGLNVKQRLHFLIDHSEDYFDESLKDSLRDVGKFNEYKQFASNQWNLLPKEIKFSIESHVIQGIYENGGELSGYTSENEERNNGYIGDDIKSAVNGILVLIDCTEDPDEKERLRDKLKDYDYQAN